MDDKFPCLQKSITKTRLPLSASPAAVLRLVVVLPTPPFTLKNESVTKIFVFNLRGIRL